MNGKLVGLFSLVLFYLVLPAALLPGQVEIPRVLDERLSIQLFAAEPQIVTPTGIAVDRRGRVFCIESHTHFRPADYAGPAADRIRIYEDTTGDGQADRVTNYFEGTTATMNLAFAPDGTLYVATRSRIFRLEDRDGNDRADSETTVVDLKTEGNYPHNGLSGLAFLDGKLYFGFGENLGAAYQMVGTDGQTLSGGGEGGNVYRCNLDGTELERWATGFWNPFGLAFDRTGNLLAIDNDPDWRPPCRLIHVVAGGDYGYRFSHGRRGTHPFTAWFGELPGTLGMVSGTGEAPSGILRYETLQPVDSDANRAADYGNFLVTSWGLHAIESYRLQPQGASFVATTETLIKGNQDFRPVGIASGPDGTIYISDWCKRSYELHGHGRIWKVTVRQPDGTDDRANRTEGGFAIPSADEAYPYNQNERVVRESAANRFPAKRIDFGRAVQGAISPLEQATLIRRSGRQLDPLLLIDFFNRPDPFVRQAARHAVVQQVTPEWLAKFPWPDDPQQRRGLALVMRHWGQHPEIQQRIPELLDDEDPEVRLVALKWIGEERLQRFADRLEQDIGRRSLTGKLFEAYLAALDMLNENRQGAEFEKAEAEIMAKILNDPQTAPETLVIALRKLQNIGLRDQLETGHPRLQFALLKKLLENADARVAREAVATIRDLETPESRELLREIVRQSERYLQVATDAVIGLDPSEAESRRLLLEAAAQGQSWSSAAWQTLAGAELTESEAEQLKQHGITRNAWRREPIDRRTSLARSAASILEKLETADPERGRLIFHNRQFSQCAKCHQVDGRGGIIGPDLSHLDNMTHERLLESILDPSQEIAPRHTPWLIETYAGQSFTGVLVAERGDIQTYADASGQLIPVRFDDIERKKPVTQSVMPDSLLDRMTDQEIADLLCFLKSPETERDEEEIATKDTKNTKRTK